MGGGGGSSSGGYDVAPMQYQAKKARQERLSQTLAGAKDKEQAKKEFLEAEWQAQSSGSKVAQETIRAGAISELEKRMANVVPGTLGIIAKQNLQRQIDALRAGGTPTKALSGSGRFVTVGVKTTEGQILGRGPALEGGQVAGTFDMNLGGDDRTPEVTPEVTGETAPDATTAGSGALERTQRGRKRTRGKRFGGAGDFGEGILIRNTSK